MRTSLSYLALLGAMTVASTASAHLTLTDPPARHPASDLKQGPCGVGPNDSRTSDPQKITTYMAGETITVTWTEVIDHDPSHYRIAFSHEGDAFVDPTGFDDTDTVFPELLDGIPDADAGQGHEYSVEVTLPNEPCDACSLQVIQVMHDKPPWGPEGGDDIYYQCADIVILEDPNQPDPDPTDPDPTGDGGAPTMGSGGSSSGGATSGGAASSGGAPSAIEGTGGDLADPAAGTGGALDGDPGSSSDTATSGSNEPAACAQSHRGAPAAPYLFFIFAASAMVLRRRALGS